MDEIKNHFKKYWHIWILALIMLAAFFIHIWHFQDWLVFTSDQARDAYFVKDAFNNGLSHLRLLGPKVDMAYIEGDSSSRGDTLHLGPFYYYLQFFSAIIFRSVQPWTIALPDMLMFIFSIPLFYYLIIQFFSKKVSLLVAALYAFSYFNLLYSKFGWNPNQLFFWEILLVLSLVKMSLSNGIDKGRWLVLVIFSLLVISQVHLVAFVGFAVFFLIFIIFYRPTKIPLKYWIMSLLLVLIFLSPMVISDIKNKGDNSKRFLVSLSRKEEDASPFPKRISKTYDKTGEFFSLSLTSFHEREIDKIETWGGIFFIFSSIVVVFIFITSFKPIHFKNKRISIKVANHQRHLIFVIILWAACFSVLFFKIYEKLDNERYFIILSPLVFIILGLWLSFFEKIKIIKIRNGIIFFVSAALLFFNLQATYSFYDVLGKGEELFRFNRNLKLGPYNELITYGQMRDAFAYMKEQSLLEKKILCLHSLSYQYNSGFEYINDISHSTIYFDQFNDSDKYSNCIYFVAGKTKRKDGDVDRDYLKNFRIVGEKNFGALTVWRLNLKNEVKDRKIKQTEKSISDKKERKRAEIWSELFLNPPYKN